jgi:hypothetical protein
MMKVFGLFLSGLVSVSMSAGPVELRSTAEGSTLMANGQAFEIKGAGGTDHFDLLAASGGNAVRTWGVDEGTGELLDRAHEHGLKVAVGIWLGHARHGFDYGDEAQVREQLESARAAVRQFKDHPAVLLWGVGNEMEEYGETTDPRVWNAVNEVAAMIKQEDPDHPTMTVIAEIGGDKLASIGRYCPDIDIVGINSYGGINSIPERYAAAGLDKPYVVAEFGPPGTWEIPSNDWGVPVELTSTAKADIYAEAYRSLHADPSCLGSFAFLWGNKQEATATWFGMLLPDGTKLGAVDAMAELWSGRPPANLAPTVASLRIEGRPIVEPGQTVRATLEAEDAEGDPLAVEWVLYQEMDEFESAGDFRATPPTFPQAIVSADAEQARIKMPDRVGNYRLFAYVRDGRGGGAVTNVPLRVGGDESVAFGRAVNLPLVVVGEADDALPFIPSGYMGNTTAITMIEGSQQRPYRGASCLEVIYAAPGAWGGVVWQDPPNDWGDADGGFDLREAGTLRFHARGAEGGEQVTFGFGVIGPDKPFYDTAKAEVRVTLTQDWKAYEIDLDGKDLSRIKTGFFWSAAGQGDTLRFFLDDVAYLPAE